MEYGRPTARRRPRSMEYGRPAAGRRPRSMEYADLLYSLQGANRMCTFDGTYVLCCSLQDNRLNDDAKQAVKAAAGSRVELAL